MGKKVLVAYFSASGVTAQVGKNLAEALGVDLYEITPKDKYSSADLDWRNPNSRSCIENNDAKSRPELADSNANVEDYDLIFLGYPIWWDTAPRIINSFLENYDFSGKHVLLFATSGGSDISKSVRDLQNTYTRIHFDSGRLLNPGISQDELRSLAAKYV